MRNGLMASPVVHATTRFHEKDVWFRIGSYISAWRVEYLVMLPQASVYFDFYPHMAFRAEHVLDRYVPLCLIDDLRIASLAFDGEKFFSILVAHHKSLSVVESAPSTVADGEGM